MTEELSYEVLSSAKSNLRVLRFFKGINATQRAQLKAIIDKIEDETLGVETKSKHLVETYKEMKSHKSITDDSEKAKILIKDFHEDLNKTVDAFGKKALKIEKVVIDEAIFKINEKDTDEEKSEKNMARATFIELEGRFVVSSADGGEPKKPKG